MRNAINTTIQNDLMAKQGLYQNECDDSWPVPGEKRSYEGTLHYVGSQPDPEAYSSVAADGDWTDYNNKCRKLRNSGDNVPELFGVKPEPQRDICIRHLNYANRRNPEDLDLIVKHHCRRRDVEIIFATAFSFKHDKQRANCKITVKEADFMETC